MRKSGEDIKRKEVQEIETTEEIERGKNIKMERQKQEWLREEREIEAAATAPRLVFWQRSINSSSNLSRKSHSPAYAAANTDSETEEDTAIKLTNKNRLWLLR